MYKKRPNACTASRIRTTARRRQTQAPMPTKRKLYQTCRSRLCDRPALVVLHSECPLLVGLCINQNLALAILAGSQVEWAGKRPRNDSYCIPGTCVREYCFLSNCYGLDYFRGLLMIHILALLHRCLNSYRGKIPNFSPEDTLRGHCPLVNSWTTEQWEPGGTSDRMKRGATGQSRNAFMINILELHLLFNHLTFFAFAFAFPLSPSIHSLKKHLARQLVVLCFNTKALAIRSARRDLA